MVRRKAGESARDRTLSDDELRSLWRAAEADTGPFGPYVRFLFLTATRRNEAAYMAWDELSGGDWVIPAARMKGGVEPVVPLSPAACAVLESIPRIGLYVFTGRGETSIGGFSWHKSKLSKASGVTEWRPA